MKFTRAELEALHSAALNEAALLDSRVKLAKKSKYPAAAKAARAERDVIERVNLKLGRLIRAKR